MYIKSNLELAVKMQIDLKVVLKVIFLILDYQIKKYEI